MRRYLNYLSILLVLSCAKEDSQAPDTSPSQIIRQYTLSVSAGDGGSVSTTGGSFASGTQVSITATPNSGYSFSGWSNGSTANPLNVTLNSNTTVTANFQVIVNSYSLTVSAGEGGTVNSGGEYEEGSQVTITATPNEGYSFLAWSNGSTDNPIVITVDSNISLEAEFENILESYREEVLNKINALEDYINQIETVSEISTLYNQLIYEISNVSDSVEGINEEYNQFINNEFKSKYINYIGIQDGYYLQFGGNRYYRDTREELSNIEDENIDLIPREITINQNYLAENIDDIASTNRTIVKIQDGRIIEDWQIGDAKTYWNNVSDDDLVKFRYYWGNRNYTYEHIFGELKYMGQETDPNYDFSENPELAYYTNYKIIDYGILSADYFWPRPDYFIKRNYYYKLDSEIININDDISFELKLTNNSIPFDQIKGIYDYYSDEEFLSDPIYREIDHNDPYSYLRAFILDGQRNGYEFEYSLEYYMENMDIKFTSYTSFSQLPYGAAKACAFKLDGNGFVDIGYTPYVNYPLTDKEHNQQIIKVMYHEFGHSILSLDHTCDVGQIMYNPNDTRYQEVCNSEGWERSEISEYEDFKQRVSDMFSGNRQFYVCD